MSDTATYQINGKEYTQTYLTIDQTIEVAELLEGVNFKEFGALKPIQVIKALYKNGIIEKFFNIILKGEQPIKMGKLKFATALRVIADFLSLNELSQIIGIVSEITNNLNLNSDLISSITSQKEASSTGTT